MRRSAEVKAQLLAGDISPSRLVEMTAEDFQTEEEKTETRRQQQKALGGSDSLSDVVLDAAGEGTGGWSCGACGSQRVLISRKSVFNQGSTWCGKDDGSPVTVSCVECGRVESRRD